MKNNIFSITMILFWCSIFMTIAVCFLQFSNHSEVLKILSMICLVVFLTLTHLSIDRANQTLIETQDMIFRLDEQNKQISDMYCSRLNELEEQNKKLSQELEQLKNER